MALVIIQFFRIDKNNPAPTPQLDFIKIKNTPQKTAALIRNSCYDCHSNESTYPWYADVQPFGWFLQNHIEEGRKHMNFSTFATYDKKRQIHKLEEMGEMIDKGEMPLDSYLLGHSDANLTPEQKAELIAYFKLVKQNIELNNESFPGVEPSDFKIK